MTKDKPLPPSDPKGVNPAGTGPAQPLPDNDRDQVPAGDDAETLDHEEHGDLADGIERERDA
jgi:hypothetical protein